jgi:hypothetical protein
MSHKIKKGELADYEIRQQVAGSFGKEEHKEIVAVIKNDKVFYEILDHRNKVATAYTMDNAIELYNEL